MSDDDTDGAPEDAFALVGNEIRAEIVRTLGDRRGREGARPVLGFAELRSAVDVNVASSQFNYHLQKLVGHYVERTDEGYRMLPAGTTLYRTLRAGTFDRQESVGPIDAGLDCFFCDGRVQADYTDGEFRIDCPDCGYLYDTSSRVPPGGVEDRSEVLSRIDRYNRHKRLAFARGVCPTCASAVDVEFRDPGDVPFESADRRTVYVHLSCGACHNQEYLSVGEALLADPGLVAFCEERGVDVTATPAWEVEFVATDRSVAVRSTDPWEVSLTVELGDRALELVVDESLDVIERTRSSA